MFGKTNIPYLLIGTCTCAYQRVINVSLQENFAYIMNKPYVVWLFVLQKLVYCYYTITFMG